MKKNRNHDEGLGTVYERFMLNNYFDSLISTYNLKKILEVPLYGMTGLTGINSVRFADRGCHITLVDSNKENIEETLDLWKILPYDSDLYKIIFQEDLTKLPFNDGKFDLVWNFAALWHAQSPDLLISEMVRVSSRFVLIFMPNRKQIGYQLRKHLLDKDFFKTIDETWAGIDKAQSLLLSLGLKLMDRGVLDVPPWPDTCVPIGPFLRKIMKRGNEAKDRWTWDIMKYYGGKDHDLKEKVERFSMLENLPIPWQLKTLWAHHRYVIFSKN